MGWQSTMRASALAVAAAGLLGGQALAQDQEVKIGVIYDFTGPFAAGGSQAAAIGTQIAIDMSTSRAASRATRSRPSWPTPSPRPRSRSPRPSGS
jgi:hypothetical protein